MSEPDAKLEDFKDYLLAALADVAKAREDLAKRGLPAGSPAAPALLPRLGPTAFSWRYRIAKKQNSLVFFFDRADQETVLFDHRLRWRELPLPIPLDPSPRRPLRWEYRLHSPSFLAHPAESASAFAPATDGVADTSRPMGFTLPDGRVLWATATVSLDTPKPGIKRGPKKSFPSAAQKKVPSIKWRLNTVPDVGSPLSIATNTPEWPLELVVAWLAGLRAAQTEPETKSQSRALPAPDQENLPEGSFVNRFLASLVEAYEAADTAGHPPRIPDGHPALGFIQTIEDFAGEIDLRLTPDGQNLADHGDPDGTPLRLSHRITRLGDTARLEVRVRPPDLLVNEELREGLVQAFANNLSAKEKTSPLAERVRKQADEALLLRLGTDQRPLLLLVLPPDGEAGAALLSSVATIKPDPDGKIRELKLSSPQPGPSAPRHPLGKRIGGKSKRRRRPSVNTELIDLGDIGTPADDTLKPEARNIILGLMRALHRWGGLLP